MIQLLIMFFCTYNTYCVRITVLRLSYIGLLFQPNYSATLKGVKGNIFFRSPEHISASSPFFSAEFQKTVDILIVLCIIEVP